MNQWTFEGLMAQHDSAIATAVQDAEVYREAYAKAWLASTEKTGDGRKYAADAETSGLRLVRDLSQARVQHIEHLVMHLRGREEL